MHLPFTTFASMFSTDDFPPGFSWVFTRERLESGALCTHRKHMCYSLSDVKFVNGKQSRNCTQLNRFSSPPFMIIPVHFCVCVHVINEACGHLALKVRLVDCCSDVCPCPSFSCLHILSWRSTRMTPNFLLTPSPSIAQFDQEDSSSKSNNIKTFTYILWLGGKCK